MSTTKSRKSAKKSHSRSRGRTKTRQHKSTLGEPLVIVQAPTPYEVLMMARNLVDVALGQLATQALIDGSFPMPSMGQQMPFINNWHTEPHPEPGMTYFGKHSRQYRPAPATSAPEQKTWRARVNEWITDYIGPRESGRTDEDYRQAYKGAYRQLMLRYHVDVEQRARKAADKFVKAGKAVPEGSEPMDFVERLGLMEELFKIVCEIYPLHEVNPDFRSEPVLAGPQGCQG